ncbi:MAG: hypothetical protein ACI4OA_01465, partial [Selenomonadaceae bacterium]
NAMMVASLIYLAGRPARFISLCTIYIVNFPKNLSTFLKNLQRWEKRTRKVALFHEQIIAILSIERNCIGLSVKGTTTLDAVSMQKGLLLFCSHGSPYGGAGARKGD